jgi:hypothetical protein
MNDSGKLLLQLYFKGVCLNKVRAIKALKVLCGFGLKESKSHIDRAENTPTIISIPQEISTKDIDDFINTMVELGGECNPTGFEEYRDSIKEIALMATLRGDTYVAKTILMFMSTYLSNDINEEDYDQED